MYSCTFTFSALGCALLPRSYVHFSRACTRTFSALRFELRVFHLIWLVWFEDQVGQSNTSRLDLLKGTKHLPCFRNTFLSAQYFFRGLLLLYIAFEITRFESVHMVYEDDDFSRITSVQLSHRWNITASLCWWVRRHCYIVCEDVCFNSTNYEFDWLSEEK